MKRSHRRISQVTLAVAALALTTGGIHLIQASADPSSATGYATQNGGTTGGQGGRTVRATTGTQIHQALCQRSSRSAPIIIEVEGTVSHGNTSKVSGSSCSTAADKIELKGVSNITIRGAGQGATFDQLGIHLREASNIVIQNVTVQNVKKSGSPLSNGGDAIGMEGNVHNVWVDHTTLKASGGESKGYDGLFDLKNNTKYVTLSYSIMQDSGRGGLIGSSESDTSNGFVTFHHNLYKNIDSRTPLLRGGVAHMYNNHYVNLGKSGINSRAGAKARVDNNYFENSKNILGTFYTNTSGSWQTSGNILDHVTWAAAAATTHPAGSLMQSITSISIPYSFSPDPARCVPQIVHSTAGSGKSLKVSDGNCSSTTPTPPSASTPPELAPPEMTPPKTAPPEIAPPKMAPPKMAPPKTKPPKKAPPKTTPPKKAPPEMAPPKMTPPMKAPWLHLPVMPPVVMPPIHKDTNLSLGAGSGGSSKARKTSYGNVRDGKLNTYWSPQGSTGSISIKWGSATKVGSVVIREAPGATGAIRSWRLVNADNGKLLTSGTGTGQITFTPTSLRKITFTVTSATGSPRIAEFETHAE